MFKRIICILLALAALFLAGCSMRTVDQMYCLPKRPESYNNLQTTMDAAMTGREYCAPRAGENQQTVQMADLDGDGIQEYLLFTKSSGDMPLQVLIFDENEEEYYLSNVIESTGAAFELVEYVQMDDKPGVEIVLGRQVSEQVVRSLSVYTFSDGSVKQLLSANYSKFFCCDMDTDGLQELMILRPGQTDMDNGVAELYTMKQGVMERYSEARMSCSVDKLKRVIIGNLHGGIPAVFVGSTMEENTIITDVYAMVNGQFRNVSLSNDLGTSVKTLRNYYVYADDIDSDGEVELPYLISMTPIEQGRSVDKQYLIRWYSMNTDGAEVDKMYTYHNYVGGWYMQLDAKLASRISVVQEGNAFVFYLWNKQYSKYQKLYTVYALTGNDRNIQTSEENQFVLYRGESILYVAQLEKPAADYGITEDTLIPCFNLIHQDWKTGEM